MAEDPKNPINDKMKAELERIQAVARESGPKPLGQQPRFVPGKGVVAGKSSIQDVLERLKNNIMTAVAAKNDALKDNLVKSIMFETKLPEDVVKKALNAYVKEIQSGKPAAAKPAAPEAATPTGMPEDLPPVSEDLYPFDPNSPEAIAEGLDERGYTHGGNSVILPPKKTPAAVAPSAPAAGAQPIPPASSGVDSADWATLSTADVWGMVVPKGSTLDVDSSQGICLRTSEIWARKMSENGFQNVRTAWIDAASPFEYEDGRSFKVGHKVAIGERDGKTYILDLPQTQFMGMGEGQYERVESYVNNATSPAFENLKEVAGDELKEYIIENYGEDGYYGTRGGDQRMVSEFLLGRGENVRPLEEGVVEGTYKGIPFKVEEDGLMLKPKRSLVTTQETITPRLVEINPSKVSSSSSMGPSKSLSKEYEEKFALPETAPVKNPANTARDLARVESAPERAPIEKPATAAPEAAPKKLDKIPPLGSIYHYEFEPVERGTFDPNEVKGLLKHNGVPGTGGYPEPLIPGDTDSNLEKIKKGTRTESTRSYNAMPSAKAGDIINVGSEKSPHYARLTGVFQILAFDRDNGLVAMRDMSNNRVFTRDIRDIARAEGYNARSFARSRRTFMHPDKPVPNVSIPEPIERFYDTRPVPKAAPAGPTIVPGTEPPAAKPTAQAAAKPAAKPAATPTRTQADIQQDMLFAFKLPAGPDRQKILLDLGKELSALESAVSPAEPQGVVQTPPQGETPVSVAPTAISGESAEPLPAPTQKIATAATPEGEKLPPISEAIESAAMPARVRVPGIESSGSRIDAHFINAYFTLVKEAAKIKDEVKGVADDGTVANLKHIMNKRAPLGKRDQAVKRLTLAYRIRGKYLVYLALAGQAPRNAPPAVVNLFTKVGKELKANLIKSGVDPDVVGAMQRSIIQSGGLGIREPKGQKQYGPSGQRSLDRIMATHEYLNRNPSVVESNPQYAGMIDYMIGSMQQSLDIFENEKWSGFNPYFEDDNILPVDYEQRFYALKRGAEYWEGIDNDAIKAFTSSIHLQFFETPDGESILKFRADPEIATNMGTPWAQYIADAAMADPESDEVDAEIKKAISRIYRAIIAYEDVDKNGRRSGIRDLWLDENGFITEAQKWLDAYGLGGDYQMDKSARIDYRPGLDFAPADIEPKLRDGFNQFMNRHPWLFPVLKGEEASSLMSEATGERAYIGDYGSIGAYGIDRVSKISSQLTTHNMRDLPAGTKLVLIENKSLSDPISLALYDTETGKPTDVDIIIRPGRFGVAFASEVSAYSAAEQAKFDIEITDMPTEWIAYRPVVNSELAQVYPDPTFKTGFQDGRFSLVANASGVGTLEQAKENQHEMNGFAKLTLAGNLMYQAESEMGVKGLRSAVGIYDVSSYADEALKATIAAVPQALQPDQTMPNQMVSVSVFIGYQKKRKETAEQPAGELVAQTPGAEIRSVTKGGEKVFGVIAYELEDDLSKPIYKKIQVPAVLVDPSLDPESPLLRNPRLSALRELVLASAEMTKTPLSVAPRPEMVQVMARPQLTGQGAFQVVANGKRPGTPILEGLGLSGDQAVGESVAQQFDGDAEFYKNRRMQQNLETEGGLPKDTLGDILQADSPERSPVGSKAAPDHTKLIWEGRRPASSARHIAVVIDSIKERYAKIGIEISDADVKRHTLKMARIMKESIDGTNVEDTVSAVNRILSGVDEKVPLLEESSAAREKVINVPDAAIDEIGKSDPADIMARLMQDYVDFEIFVARKLHYSTVKSEKAPDNQNMDLPYAAVGDIIDSVSGLDTVRGTLHKSEIDRVADYLVGRMDPTKRKMIKTEYPGAKETNSVFNKDTNPAILQYPGAKKKGAQQEIDMAWTIATDAEKALIEGFSEGMPQAPMSLPESAAQTLAAPTEEVSFGQGWNKNLESRPSRRGETIISLLKASKVTMAHMEAILSDGSFIQANGALLEKIGVAAKSEDGNTYVMKPGASFQKVIPVGTKISIPADDAAMRDIEGAKMLVAKPVQQQAPAPDPMAQEKIASAKAAVEDATKRYEEQNALFQSALKEQANISEKYKEQIAAGETPKELADVRKKIEKINGQRTQISREIETYKKTIADLSASEASKIKSAVQTFAVPTETGGPVENVYEKLRKMIALGGESRKRAQRIIKLAERIYSHNLSTQTRGVFGQLVRQIERASANVSRSSIIEAIGYGKLPETWQAEVDPAFIDEQQFRRYPEVISQDESGNVTYVIDDFGPTNPVFRGTQEDAYSEDGETATWRLVNRLVSKGRVSLVLVQNADGTYEFGLMAIERTQAPDGKFTYKAKEAAIDTKSTSVEAMQQYLESVGLDAYVNVMTSFDEFVPPEYDQTDTTPQDERIRIENELREEYLRKQRMVLAEQNITGFEADVLMQQYELEMNKDFFTNANPELAEKPETALFDSAINMKFYLDLASRVELEGASLRGAVPDYMIGKDGALLPEGELYNAMVTNSQYHLGVIKNRSIAMESNNKVKTRRLAIGEGQLDYLQIKQANERLKIEEGTGTRSRANAILDLAVMKAEQKGFGYKEFENPVPETPNGKKGGPGGIGRYTRSVARGTLGAAGILALLHELKYGKYDYQDESASLGETLGKKAESYAPMLGVIGGAEAISRLPVLGKAAGPAAGLAMLGYTAATGGDTLRTAIGLLGGAVGGIGGAIFTGGVGAMAGGIAGGVIADEIYSKVTGQDSLIDFRPMDTTNRKVVQAPSVDTRTNLEERFTSGG